MGFNLPLAPLELGHGPGSLGTFITQEQHPKPSTSKIYVSPKKGPFYTYQLKVYHGSGKVLLTEGTDYKFIEQHQELTLLTGQDIYRFIEITKTNVNNPIYVTYVPVGGLFGGTSEDVRNLYEVTTTGDQATEFSTLPINPSEMSALELRNIDDNNGLYRLGTIVDELERIQQTLSLGRTSDAINIIDNMIVELKCSETGTINPYNRILKYDSLLHLITKRKLINKSNVVVNNCTWSKSSTYTISINTVGEPNSKVIRWYAFSPDTGVNVSTYLNTVSGSVTSSGGGSTYTVNITTKNYTITPTREIPIYIGLKYLAADAEYLAISQAIKLTP